MLIIPILVFFTEQEVVVRGDRVGWQETHQGSQVAYHSPGPKQKILSVFSTCVVFVLLFPFVLVLPFHPIRPYMASMQPLPIMMAIFLGYLWTVSHIFNL